MFQNLHYFLVTNKISTFVFIKPKGEQNKYMSLILLC